MNFEDLIRRAWRDETFKTEFLAEPASVIKREIGITLDDRLSVYAHAQSETDVHLLIQEDIREDAKDFEPLIQRALEDEAFKAEFKADPGAIIERELGVELPDDITIYVHEQTETEVHLVIPLPPDA